MTKFLSTAALLALLSVTNAAGQWTVKLPQPTGPYQIGTTYFALVDETRQEAFTDDPKDHRELLVRCWYPAQSVAGAKPEPFWGKDTKEIGSLLAQFMRLPKTAFDDLTLVQSHAYTDAPLSKSKSPYPVLVFSHGYIPGFLSQNTAQMEELASHGYVVFSIGHAYETVANIFPDGRVVPFSQARLVAFGQGAGKTRDLNAKYAAATEPSEKEALLKRIVADWTVLDESVRIWAADVRFVLDTLEMMKSNKPKNIFAGKLDLKRIGIFGMSFGGATAGQVCLVDSRCKAGINLDGLQFGDLIDRPMERPFMFMQSEDARNINRLFFDRAKNDAYYVVVKGTRHFNYSDFSLFSPDYQKAGLLGPIDGARMEVIMNAYVLAFFDKYLRGKDSPLLKTPSATFPEVEFSSHKESSSRPGKENAMEFVGKRLVLRYESGLRVAGFYESPSQLTWEALSGPSKGATGRETIAAKQVGPRLYFINWVEGSGTTVSQVLDFDSAKVTCFVTYAAGTERRSLLDTGSIEVQP